MKTIPQLLNKTNLEYELMYLSAYMRWCESVTINDYQLQMVMANTPVNKWYNFEYAKCETEFLKLIANYQNIPTVTAKDAQELYNDCTYNMFNLRCEILIKEAIKNNLQYDTARN